MDDAPALDSPPSDAVVADSSAPLLSSPSDAPFHLLGLPYELREKIVLDDDINSRDALMTVNQEFHSIVASWAWETKRLYGDESVAQIVALGDSVQRYGGLVKELYLYNYSGVVEPPTYVKRLRAPVARVLARLPNLSKLSFIGELARTIAVSPHLDSLTYLRYDLDIDDHKTSTCRYSLAMFTLIASCPNLAHLELHNLKLSRTKAPLLIEAIASRSRLATLVLEWCTFIIDASMAGINWICPLENLTMHCHNRTRQISLPTLHTFLSHFTDTLVRLKVCSRLGHSSGRPSTLTPFPLPHLTHLDLKTEHRSLNLPHYVYDMPSLFNNSPIQVANIRISETSQTRDGLTLAMAQRLINTHGQTLKTLDIGLNDPKSRTLAARTLETDAQRLEIKLSLSIGYPPLHYSDSEEDESSEEEAEDSEEEDSEEEDSKEEDSKEEEQGDSDDGED